MLDKGSTVVDIVSVSGGIRMQSLKSEILRLTTCLSFGICFNVSDVVFYRELVRVPISFSYTVNTNEVMVTDSDRIRMMLSYTSR